MRTLIGIVLTLSLLLGTFGSAAAQQPENPVIAGVDDTITWIDAEGTATAAVQLTEVNTDFTHHEPEEAADFGYRYQSISFSVENVSDASIIIKRSMFTTITDHGELARELFLEPTSEAYAPFVEDVPLAPGEAVELTILYTTPEFSELALFRWSFDSENTLYVYLSPESGENSSVVRGLSTPAMYFDDFGNPIATIEVTGINPNWSAYSDFSEPDEGESYLAVHITVTNQTDRPVRLRSSHFRVVTDTGQVQRAAYASANEDAQGPLANETFLEPGDSLDFYLVFDSTPETGHVAVQWDPNWADSMFIMLTDGESATPAASPEATPAGD